MELARRGCVARATWSERQDAQSTAAGVTLTDSQREAIGRAIGSLTKLRDVSEGASSRDRAAVVELCNMLARLGDDA